MPSPAEDVAVLEDHLHGVARGEYADEAEYQRVRERLLSLPVAPAFLRACPSYERLRVQFLKVAKGEGSYAARDGWARAQMAELNSQASGLAYASSPPKVHEVFERVDHHWVQQHWKDAREFLGTRDAQAVGAARSMLESVCKAILTEHGIARGESWDVKRLMTETRRVLGLQGVDPLAQMMDGLAATMRAMARIRAKAGADHGLGPEEEGVDAEVAELFVNTAGAIAVFLRRRATTAGGR